MIRIFPLLVVFFSHVQTAVCSEYEGLLFPSRQVMLSTQGSGIVKNLPFKPGQRVTEGTVILSLDSKKDSLNLVLSQRKLERSKIEKSGEVENRINYELAQIAYEEKTIKAPFSGTITDILTKKYEHYSAGSKAVELCDLSVLKTEIHVTSEDIIRLKHGKPKIFVNRMGKKVFGEMISFNPIAEPGIELFLVEIRLKNKYSWPPGTGVKVVF